ncbi:MAG: hypothetical protein AMXMBFR4_30170 [Candidatus Hydrogenedentota bacterium]
MAGMTKILPVPYYVQESPVHCQSTCLRMYAEYLERHKLRSATKAAETPIPEIWKQINTGNARPYKIQNSHANMMWWLETNFPPLKFTKKTTMDPDGALYWVIRSIDAGFPVMASVSHKRVAGHIILLVGYKDYAPDMCVAGADFTPAPAVMVSKIIAHDPYGAFDPSLSSAFWGEKRWHAGMSLAGGGQAGPGRGVELAVENVNRRRTTAARAGNFELMSAGF